MAYATSSDIANEFKSIDFVNGALKSAAVDEWCTQASNLIDSYLAGKYVVPVSASTSPNAFSILKMLCIGIVKPRLSTALGTQTGAPKTSQNPGGQGGSPVGSIPKDISDTLSKLQSGAMTLTDGVLQSTSDGVNSYTSSNVSADVPKFTREDDQW